MEENSKPLSNEKPQADNQASTPHNEQSGDQFESNQNTDNDSPVNEEAQDASPLDEQAAHPNTEQSGASSADNQNTEATTALNNSPQENRLDVTPVAHFYQSIKKEITQLVVGQDEMLELLVTALLTGGHCLLEGLPGIAKTLTAKSLSKSIDVPFSRIQFTPDLMPTDVTGTTVFNLKESEFNFKKGPIFSSIVLIDEINRAPAKTQAALMEVMEEKQITYDGVSYPMAFPFFVIATQNPIEQEGTYTLPEAQLDRFLFRIKMDYPQLHEEELILKRFEKDFSLNQQNEVNAVVGPDKLKEVQLIIEQVYIKEELLRYIAAIVNNTRKNGDLHLGASPRASLAIMKCSKAFAALNGRDFVTPDDIKRVCIPILNHRVILSHEREMEGSTVEEIIQTILETVEVPR